VRDLLFCVREVPQEADVVGCAVDWLAGGEPVVLPGFVSVVLAVSCAVRPVVDDRVCDPGPAVVVVTAPADGVVPAPGLLEDVLELALGVGVGVDDEGDGDPDADELGLGLPVLVGEDGGGEIVEGGFVALPLLVPVEQFVPLSEPGELPGAVSLAPPGLVCGLPPPGPDGPPPLPDPGRVCPVTDPVFEATWETPAAM
jgi:hypothetical protein